MSQLRYPFATPPEAGSALEVAPGLLWLRMALPMALDHINLYLLKDDGGWWVVDTGIGGTATQNSWLQVFDEVMGGEPLLGVISTHMHPDHIGQAGWLCERFGAPFYMSQTEYLMVRTLAKMSSEEVGWNTEQYYRRNGLGDDYVAGMRRASRGFGALAEPVPTSYRRLREGDRLEIGGRSWQVVIGRGHSPEHVCLYSAEDKLLLSGDQLIPKITSNISVMSMEPEANPLQDWFDSIEMLKQLLPEDTLVMPAHNTPFYGAQQRLSDLREHHEEHLAALEEACIEPKTAFELLPVLFSRKLEGALIAMALGECVAHLNYLINTDRIERTLDDDGVYGYRTRYPERVKKGPHIHDDAPLQV